MSRMGYGAWLRSFLSLPGRLFVSLSHPKHHLPPASISLTEAENLIRHSPRGNNYLALEPEISGFGDQSGYLGYATLGTTLLSVGGIHGKDGIGALSEWKKQSLEAGFKRLLLFPVLSHERDQYKKEGFQSIHVGSEALIDVQRFHLSGRPRRNLRQTIQRANRDNQLVLRETRNEDLPQLQKVFEEWLDSRIRDYRMKVLVGSPGFDEPFGRRFFTCCNNGLPVAFITITPGWNEKGWGMDIMARSPQAPPGVMEWLIVQTIEQLRDEGAQTFSLGACPMRLTERKSPNESRILRFAFEGLYRGYLGGRLFRFRELARFKEKFCPTWIPIYFGGYPNVSIRALYDGCRMWGLFDSVDLTSSQK